MGQRTQILLVKKHNDGTQTAHVLHRQWGFGRQMYLALMDLLISDYFKDTWKQDYSYDKDVMPFSVFPTEDSLKHSLCDRYIPERLLKNIDLNNVGNVREIFEHCDNNNGGLVIQMTEPERKYGASEFKIAFMLGSEDSYTYDENDKEVKIEEPFTRYLTPAEYGEMNGGKTYSDAKFVKIFNDFCDYFQIQRVGMDCEAF